MRCVLRVNGDSQRVYLLIAFCTGVQRSEFVHLSRAPRPRVHANARLALIFGDLFAVFIFGFSVVGICALPCPPPSRATDPLFMILFYFILFIDFLFYFIFLPTPPPQKKKFWGGIPPGRPTWTQKILCRKVLVQLGPDPPRNCARGKFFALTCRAKHSKTSGTGLGAIGPHGPAHRGGQNAQKDEISHTKRSTSVVVGFGGRR
jgi:hypothetical protein